jgi:hypothetical protein
MAAVINDDYMEVLAQAQAVACNMYNASGQTQGNSEPRILDMAITGDIPEGYTHLIFVAIHKDGYVVSRSLEGAYKVEIHDQIVRPMEHRRKNG